MNRKLSQVYPSRPSRDGDGVKINRIAGASMHRILDPFLMTRMQRRIIWAVFPSIPTEDLKPSPT